MLNRNVNANASGKAIVNANEEYLKGQHSRQTSENAGKKLFATGKENTGYR